MKSFPFGATLKLKATCTNENGVVADPATVTFKIKSPVGTVTTLVYGTDVAVVKETTGIYYVNQYCDRGGLWSWQCLGTGPNGAEQNQFQIEQSVI